MSMGRKQVSGRKRKQQVHDRFAISYTASGHGRRTFFVSTITLPVPQYAPVTKYA
jgi:hypothetical protein